MELTSAEKNYVGTSFDYATDTILVWERPIGGGERTIRRVPAPRYFYVPDPNGEFEGLDGTKLTKLSFSTKDDYQRGCMQHRVKYESDISPEARVLMDDYVGRPVPKSYYALLDIETDYTSSKGFAGPKNPYGPISAVTVYQSWQDAYATIVVPPFPINNECFLKYKKQLAAELKFVSEPEVELVANETRLLSKFLLLIDDADMLSGWNSEIYDIPYIIERLKKVFGPNAGSRLCFKGANQPRLKMVNRFGTEEPTYVLSGRAHVDYLDAVKKFTFEGRASYSLANVAAEELDFDKLDYEGTLEELYNGTYRPNIRNSTKWNTIDEDCARTLDRFNLRREYVRRELERVRGLAINGAKSPTHQPYFDEDPSSLSDDELQQQYAWFDEQTKVISFVVFCLYNYRDVETVRGLDKKFKFMQLVNQMAHENTVPYPAILGTVRYVQTGILNRAHAVHKKIAHDKPRSNVMNAKVEGAIVLTPQAGLHQWLGSVDITSLYPSVIRLLGMSYETFVGQFVDEDQAFNELRDRRIYDVKGRNGKKNTRYRTTTDNASFDNKIYSFVYENGVTEERTGAEWNKWIAENNYAISAFGTIFRQDKPGIVADTLTFWFEERIRLRKIQKAAGAEAARLRKETGIEIDEAILKQLR